MLAGGVAGKRIAGGPRECCGVPDAQVLLRLAASSAKRFADVRK